MQTFFIEIAAVNCAAKLCGFNAVDNYAVFGAMKGYRDINPGEISKTDGIDDVPLKTDSFRFGTHCGKILEKYTGDFNEGMLRICEAQVARTFFVDINGPCGKKELSSTLLTVAESLVKRAQIRTHTTKPGYEDINAWLKRYYAMQQDYCDSLPELVDAIVNPDDEALRISKSFLDENDAIIKFAVGGKGSLEDALVEEAKSIFGKILKEIAQLA